MSLKTTDIPNVVVALPGIFYAAQGWCWPLWSWSLWSWPAPMWPRSHEGRSGNRCSPGINLIHSSLFLFCLLPFCHLLSSFPVSLLFCLLPLASSFLLPVCLVFILVLCCWQLLQQIIKDKNISAKNIILLIFCIIIFYTFRAGNAANDEEFMPSLTTKETNF